MALSLKQQMAADTSAVFLRTDEFAENCILYRGGSAAPGDKIPFVGVVEHEEEEGSGGRLGSNVHGDGRFIDEEAGKRLRRSVTFRCAASVPISDTRQTNKEDILEDEEGSLYKVIRIISRDPDMQAVLCVKVDKVTHSKPKRRG